MPTPKKPKAELVADKAMVELLTRQVSYYRKSASELRNEIGYVPGIGSYALYGIKHSAQKIAVLASEPTSSDFSQYITAKAKAAAVAKYDHVVEYRDTGTAMKPKVTILCWRAAK